MIGPQRRSSGREYLVAIWLLYVLCATVFFFKSPSIQPTNDAGAYLRTAAAPLSSQTFWVGEKPPLVPLIYKVLSNNPRSFVRFQFILSIFAWSTLACTCAAFVKRASIRNALFAGVLTLSLGSDVSMWSHTIMSEGIDLSIFAWLLSSWLLLIDRPTSRRCVVVVLLSGLWVMSRDSNATILLMVSMSVGAVLSLSRFQGRRKWYSFAAGASLVFGLTGMQCNSLSGRWQFPFYNVLSQRILPYPDRLAFFKEDGMPTPPALLDLKGLWAYSNGFAYWLDLTLDDFRKWANRRARHTYVLFVLKHPGFIQSSRSELPETLFPALNGYYFPGPLPAPAQDGINAWMRARIGYVFAIFALLAIGALLTNKSGGGLRPQQTAAYAMVWIALPEYLVIWLADPMDIDRHYLSMAVALRLSALLLAATIGDNFSKRSIRAGKEDRSSRVPAAKRPVQVLKSAR